jgi:hypothetical protein
MPRREPPELWVGVPGYGRYEVSTHGRVRNRETGKVLSPYCGTRARKRGGGPDPRPMVDIRPDGHAYPPGERGERRQPHVSGLGCLAFYGPRPCPGAQAEHEDGDTMNNRISNLSWQSGSVNELRKVFQGKRMFLPEDVRFIRRCPMSALDLSFYFDCSVNTIYAIRAGRLYRQVTSDLVTDSLPHVKPKRRKP